MWHMNKLKHITIRLSPEMVDEINATNYGENQTEKIRTLIRIGLKAKIICEGDLKNAGN